MAGVITGQDRSSSSCLRVEESSSSCRRHFLTVGIAKRTALCYGLEGLRIRLPGDHEEITSITSIPTPCF